MKIRFLLPLPLGLLLLGACKKEDPEAGLPAATQQGLNTSGFLLDGEAYPGTYRAGGFMSGSNTYAVEGGYAFSIPGFVTPPQYDLRINGMHGNSSALVKLYLRHPAVGEFALNRNTGLPPSAADSTIFDHASVQLGGSSEVYATDATHTGRIVMSRASQAAMAAAGTFEFTAVSTQDPRKTVRVTAGRFDRQQ